MKSNNEIEELFVNHHGLLHTKELREHGIHYKKLMKLCSEGYVEQIQRGLYQWQDENSLFEINIIIKRFPDAILCGETALQYYDYTDRTPAYWSLAVDKDSSKTRFHTCKLALKPYYMEKKYLDIGKIDGEIDGCNVAIYDRERIICEVLRREQKMDVEIFNKTLQAYVNDIEKNVANLMKYAKILRVETKVRSKLGIWL